MLTMALMLIEHHYIHHYPATARYLELLGHQHRTRKKVPVEAYPKFRECLLAMLARFHESDWNDQLARQWGEAIDLAVKTMIIGYEPDYTP
jgi:hemoglobin-like flavoprotein